MKSITTATKLIGLAIICLTFTSACNSKISPKEQAVENFRQYFSEHAYRGHQLTKPKVEQLTSQQCVDMLGDDGRFIDLIPEQDKIESEKLNVTDNFKAQQLVGEFLTKPFNRIWRIAQLYRSKQYDAYKDDPTLTKLYKAINIYSKKESDRGSIPNGRFHPSCFAIPTAAVNTYFCLFDAMEAIENGKETNETAVKANKSLLEMS